MSEKKIMDPVGIHTRKEIEGQPELWVKVFSLLIKREAEIKKFMEPFLKLENAQIILTGAGSSAFIGEAAQGLVQKNTGKITKAIPTTDIITHPHLFFCNDPTLLVSFARSGNSPESLEVIQLADRFCENVFHLIITCNKEGALMSYSNHSSENIFQLLLPEDCNDKGLAMTGSFTSMLLSILLIGNYKSFSERETEIEKIVEQARIVLGTRDNLRNITAFDFNRVVFLGSGPLLGIARESHLKLQEMTDGKVICKHDSFLGFRHGPRAVIDQNTLLVYLFSPEDHVYRYESDLVNSITQDSEYLCGIGLGRTEDKRFRNALNIDLDLDPAQELHLLPMTLLAQMLAFLKSTQMGFNPDEPSVSGAINRVVQGVTIYEFPQNKIL